MRKNPVKVVGWMVIILGAAMVSLLMIEKKETPEWYIAMLFLFCSMSVVSAAIKHMAKRIDELEKKLENNQTLKEERQ